MRKHSNISLCRVEMGTDRHIWRNEVGVLRVGRAGREVAGNKGGSRMALQREKMKLLGWSERILLTCQDTTVTRE